MKREIRLTNIMSIGFWRKGAVMYFHTIVENCVEVVETLKIQGFRERHVFRLRFIGLEKLHKDRIR